MVGGGVLLTDGWRRKVEQWWVRHLQCHVLLSVGDRFPGAVMARVLVESTFSFLQMIISNPTWHAMRCPI